MLPLTATELIAAAERAYNDLNSTGWGEVYIIFLDSARATQAVTYASSLEGGETEQDLCAEEVQEALEAGWRPVCLQIMPYADPIIVPLREDLSLDDKAVIWELGGARDKQPT